ncbi:MAG: DUF192 domain-containing protein [Spirosomataceae bacterium]
MQKRRAFISYILLGVFVIAGALYIAKPLLVSERNESITTTSDSEIAETIPSASSGIVKEGEVVFLRGENRIRKIDVEIAENDAERQKGLMFRSYLSDSVGMLFIFNEAVPQSFWMKNTQISLDIIYIDANKKIVSIQKNAKPYSEEGLPSFANAQYVVEVNGGYCDKYDIQVGDSIRF